MSEETTAQLTCLGYSHFPILGVCCLGTIGIVQSIESKTREAKLNGIYSGSICIKLCRIDV